MTTTDGEPVKFAGVRVESVISEAADHDRQLLRIISTVIAGASSAYRRDRPHDFAPPESVVIARQRLEAVRSGQAAVAADGAVHAAGAAVEAGHQ